MHTCPVYNQAGDAVWVVWCTTLGSAALHGVAAVEALADQQWGALLASILLSGLAMTAFRRLLKLRATLLQQHTACIAHVTSQLLGGGLVVLLCVLSTPLMPSLIISARPSRAIP